MIKKIKAVFIGTALLVTALLGSTGGLVSATPYFADATPDSSSKIAACGGLTEVDPTQDCSKKGAGVDSVIKVVVKLLSVATGSVAIIMILVSGIKYITSGGDSNKVASAKNTLVYALIGVAIAAAAYALVSFAVNATV